MSIILAVNDLVEHSSIEHAVGIYIGLLLLACLVGIAAKLISHLPYTIFLTIIGLVIGIFHFGPKIEGALRSPTDPISVLAMFRKADAPEDLRVLVEGESLFNDATGVVLFTILLSVSTIITNSFADSGCGSGPSLPE
jgi:NhaP-type Na+/H+ or K+/H+ antiporter